MKRALLLGFVAFVVIQAHGQQIWKGKFEQLGPGLPTPNQYRTASGAPAENYWQQKVDYKLQVTLDDVNQQINGEAGISYFNNSPHELPFLWFQLDQNIRKGDAQSRKMQTGEMPKGMSPVLLSKIKKQDTKVSGYNLEWVRSATGADLNYVVQGTMMRIDLPKPLQPGQSIGIWIAWSYTISNRMLDQEARSGYEYFPEDDNRLYTIAQFYPRAAVYSDYEGWQNKQFTGAGEFSTNFGDYQVDITVPADMIVAATGALMNETEVLTKTQIDRLERARRTYDKPTLIVTAAEAKRNEPSRSNRFKRWHFDAENVRDFAFAASRKLIWDAMAVDVGENDAMAMSYYTKESNQLWKKYATKATAHTIGFYSKYLFEYPYPTATSVNTASQGMEYPMINFSGGRPKDDHKIDDKDIYDLISVLIHEVGHNYFPMIVNSDERALYWMDEGINTYIQYLAEQSWMWGYPSTIGPSDKVIPFMDGTFGDFRPIMTDPEQALNIYSTGYLRPATALNILRNVVLGPELFDFSLKMYANTWKFKHPTYADFFRIMEAASAVDLDWFWKGWFYSTDHVDVAVKSVKWYKLSEESPVKEVPKTDQINDKPHSFNYKKAYQGEFLEFLDDDLYKEEMAELNFYEVTFENLGGLISPLILEWQYEDTSTEREIIPAEVWRLNEVEVKKIFAKKKKVVGLRLDPEELTGDTNKSNNSFPLVEP